MMKEDQEYTEMEPGALLSGEIEQTGLLSLLSQGKAPPLSRGAGRLLKGIESSGIASSPGIESLRYSWVEVSLLSYCVGIFSHCGLLRWHSTVR